MQSCSIKVPKERNASFELMRILCMMMIVYYHLLIRVDASVFISTPELRAVTIPLHIAVVCFVLISGYFGVKESWKKILRFFIQVLFYNVLIFLFCSIVEHNFSIRGFFLSFLPITDNKDLWFVRTYFMFLLIVPILNRFIQSTSKHEYFKMCLILMFISMYIGIRGNDASLSDGKNLINFSMIYFLGHLLKEKEINISGKIIVFSYIFLNVVLVSAFLLGINSNLSTRVITYAFGYNSPLLVLNAILFFMIFVKIRIRSQFILWVANSVFPIYLIHSNSNLQLPLMQKIAALSPSRSFSYYFMVMLVIMVGCIVTDKCLQPIYKSITSICERMIVKNITKKVLEKSECCQSECKTTGRSQI